MSSKASGISISVNIYVQSIFMDPEFVLIFIAGMFSEALLPPITPCAKFRSFTGEKSLSENGVVKRPLDVLEVKLKIKLFGKLSLTPPLDVVIEIFPEGSLAVQRISPLVAFTSTEPVTKLNFIPPLDDSAETLPSILSRAMFPLLVRKLASPCILSQLIPPLEFLAAKTPVA